ncbi:SRPBCC family protein [Nonomuraea sp. NPDC050680]|uniref:SRPBCC family protein n=1 Tax=Nonomuraea sp. NPDC050680 TaxID=3154630 RepID=UPI0033D83A45
MAAIHKEALLDVPAERVWAALREVGRVDRLAPGFVLECRMEGDVRIVTFFNGAVAHELIVDVDDAARRIAYAIVDSPLGLRHHNASSTVLDEGDGRSRFVWHADLYPEEAVPVVAEFMDRGLSAMKNSLMSSASSSGA